MIIFSHTHTTTHSLMYTFTHSITGKRTESQTYIPVTHTQHTVIEKSHPIINVQPHSHPHRHTCLIANTHSISHATSFLLLRHTSCSLCKSVLIIQNHFSLHRVRCKEIEDRAHQGLQSVSGEQVPAASQWVTVTLLRSCLYQTLPLKTEQLAPKSYFTAS